MTALFGLAGAVAGPAAARDGLALTYISTATQNSDGTFVKRMGVKLPLMSETAFGMNVGFAGRVYTSSGPDELVAAPASVVWGRMRVSGEDTLPLWDTSTVALSMTPRDDSGRVNWTNTRRWSVGGDSFVASVDDKYWVNVNALADDPMQWGAGAALRFEAKRYGTVLESGLDHLSGDDSLLATLRAEQTLPGHFKLGAALSDVLDEPVATLTAQKTLADHLILSASLTDSLKPDHTDPVKIFRANYALTW